MANNQEREDTLLPEEVAQNSGARTAAINANPNVSKEEAENANAGEGPNASGLGVSDTEEHIPASSDPEATDIPSSNAPNPKEVNEQNPNAT